jgi:ribosome biogenesis protein BMS1
MPAHVLPLQDVTPAETLRQQATADRSIVLYGFLRGCNLRLGQRAHLAGVGDVAIHDIEQLPDPCPLPETIKKRGLNEQERLIYAPMSSVGGLLYDRDATYIDIPDWKVQFSRVAGDMQAEMQEGEAMVHALQRPAAAVDEQLAAARLSIFRGAAPTSCAGMSSDSDAMSVGSDDTGSVGGEGDAESGSEMEAEDADETETAVLPRGMPAVVAPSSARARRAAVFLEDTPAAVDDAAGARLADTVHRLRRRAGANDSSSNDGSDGSGSDGVEDTEAGKGISDEGEGQEARWRSRMLTKQAVLFSTRAGDLGRLVYSRPATARAMNDAQVAEAARDGGSDSSDDDGEFFKLKARPADAWRDDGAQPVAAAADDIDTLDTPCVQSKRGAAWLHSEWLQEACKALRSRFVTGGASAFAGSRARAGASGRSEYVSSDDGDENFDYFEDMEASVEEGMDDVARAAAAAVRGAASEASADARAEKLAKKAAFDAEYDAGEVASRNGATGDLGGSSDMEDGAGEGGGAGVPKKKGRGWARYVSCQSRKGSDHTMNHLRMSGGQFVGR